MKNLNEEINKMKHLFNYKKGVVISEQKTGDTQTPKVKKVFIKKYGNPGSGKCLQNPDLNNSCDSGESFVELEDGKIIKYPNMSYTSYVDNGTYEDEGLSDLKSRPNFVYIKIDGKEYNTIEDNII
jgi:hypothetical protein